MLLTAMALLGASPSPAAGDHPADAGSETELRGLETASLGAEHAAQHAAARCEKCGGDTARKSTSTPNMPPA